MHEIKKDKNSKVGVFWHPEFGFSRKQPILTNWKNSLSDPFLEFRNYQGFINKAHLQIFDNNLSNLYEISSNTIFYSKNGKRQLEVYCKLHYTHSLADYGNIFSQLTFGCKLCGKRDYAGSRRILQLKSDPSGDGGKTILYFIKIEIGSLSVLKFGVTNVKFSPLDVTKEIVNRFGGTAKLKEFLDHKVYDTELEARQKERDILIDTLKYVDDSVPSSFPGFTECRVFSKQSLKVCTHSFFELTNA